MAGNVALAIGAGLLAGVGRGVMDAYTEEVRSKKEIALEELRQRGRREESALDREARATEAAASREHSTGLLGKRMEFDREMAEENDRRAAQREQDRFSREQGQMSGPPIETDDGELVGVTRGGEKKPLDIKAKRRLSDTERFTDAQGLMWTRSATGIEAVTGPDGAQLKGRQPNENRYQAFAAERDGKKGIVVFDRSTGEEEFREGATLTSRAGGAGGSQGTARMREAEWLVKNGIYKTVDEAYASLRTGVTMSQQTMRAKALGWLASQKDDIGAPRYKTPEEQAAALEAYELFVQGRRDAALEKLKSINPKKPVDEENVFVGLARSIFGGGSGPAAAPAPSGPAAPQSPAAATPAAPAPPAASQSGSNGGLPGAGTRDDPYKATTQAQVDWFRQNAPAGSVIEVVIDGQRKLYQK